MCVCEGGRYGAEYGEDGVCEGKMCEVGCVRWDV